MGQINFFLLCLLSSGTSPCSLRRILLFLRLHSAGANNIFPQHNAFLGHDDPDLFAGVVRRTSFSHGYQVNRKFFDATSPAPPSGTTCFPVDARGQIVVTGGITSSSSYSSSSDASGGDGAGGADSSSSLVRWQKASHHAYQNAMFLTIGVGTLLLAVSGVWGKKTMVFMEVIFF